MSERVSTGGWGLPRGSRKWHYFKEDGMSLCNKFGFYRGDKKQGNDESNDNCTACKKALRRIKAKEATLKLEREGRIEY